MKISKVSKRSEPPARSCQYRDSKRGRAQRELAVKLLTECLVGQHILFEETADRTLIQSWVTAMSSKSPTKRFTICRLSRGSLGVWRIK